MKRWECWLGFPCIMSALHFPVSFIHLNKKTSSCSKTILISSSYFFIFCIINEEFTWFKKLKVLFILITLKSFNDMIKHLCKYLNSNRKFVNKNQLICLRKHFFVWWCIMLTELFLYFCLFFPTFITAYKYSALPTN